jgi:hypothetical protein
VQYKDVHLRRVYFEFVQVGTARKVVAIDPITSIEISMVCAPGYSTLVLKKMAARKLAYVIWKEREKKRTKR